jgi:hypothetical protein
LRQGRGQRAVRAAFSAGVGRREEGFEFLIFIHIPSLVCAYLLSYKFPDEELEILRSYKLAGTKQILSLRLIEKEEPLGGVGFCESPFKY